MLFVPVGDATLGQIVGSELNGYFVPWQDADVVLAHAARYVTEQLVVVLQFNPEHGVGKVFHDCSFHFDDIFFTQGSLP